MTNYSQINAVSGGQVKTADDLWLARGGVLVPAIEAWAVKNGTLVKVWERYGGATTMTWVLPTAATAIHADPVLWRVRVEQGGHLVRPKGSVQFTFSDGQSQTASIDSVTGYASVTMYHDGGQSVTATATLTSTNGFTASPVVKALTVTGGEVTLTWVEPADQQVFYGPTNIKWRVRAIPKNGLIPSGQVRFSGPSGYNYVDLDANGYAETTYYHDSGMKVCTAQITSSDEGWTSQPIDRWIRLLINTRYQSTGYFDRTSHRNYEGANGGPQNTTPIVCGDLSGKSWRAISMCSRPAKPVSDAYCVAAWAVYTPGTQSAGIRIGYHTKDAYPATGTFTGLQQNLVTGPGTQSVEQWVDIGLHVASAINNETFRGMVYGGPADSTPYSWVAVAGVFCGLVVTWEWWRWIDT